MSQEDEFYADLDKKTIRKSCCTCQTMIIFFAVLAILAGVMTIYFIHQIKAVNFSFDKINLSNIFQEGLFNKINNSKVEPTLNITITSEELTAIISSGIKVNLFEVDQMQAQIDQSAIKIFGQLIKPVKSEIKIESQPIVKDGKIKLDVQKIQAGKLSLPGLLNAQFEKALNKLMDENFAPIYENYQIENIELQNDQMLISGKLH